MRIIAGEYKGRRITAPEDTSVRPTTGKVKEAIFAMLMNDIYDAVTVDLFAGTGNLGLEALSRGARKCYFGDNSRDSLRLIKENIAHCKAEDKSVVIAGSYEKVLDRINEKADIVLLDPPYKEGLMLKCLQRINELDILADDGVIVAEHGGYEDMPEAIGSIVRVKEKRYGTINVTIYRKES